jgi:3-phenylpropionate/cinnamic acid dioxygenase small subunit
VTVPTDLGPTFVSAQLYTRVQQFYANQMRLIDEREAELWADTFTEEAVFQEASRMDPLHGRAAIRTAARANADRFAASDVRLRHWLGMLQVREESDGSLRTRCYALAMRTPTGGDLDVFVSVVCRDHLVPAGDGWLVAHRDLTHDSAGVR